MTLEHAIPLAPEELTALLEAAAREPGSGGRDRLIILLAVRAGIKAREQQRLDVHHVSSGDEPLTEILVPGRPRLTPLPATVRDELRVYLRWRRSVCAHGAGRFGKTTGSDGTERCHICQDPLDFGRAPLLRSRLHPRITERALRNVFNRLRERAGLHPRHAFEALIKTYEQHLDELLRSAIKNDR